MIERVALAMWLAATALTASAAATLPATGKTTVAVAAVPATGEAAEPVPTEPTWVEERLDAAGGLVRAALQSLLKRYGLPLEPGHAASADEFITVWGTFRQEDFGPDVAHDTPTINEDYPYVSPSRLRQGHVRLRARLATEGGQTVLLLQAELQADAFNVAEFEQQRLERFSNGTIEAIFFERIRRALAPGGDSR
jgi:hypothetical protein